jgi:hypothetical protein
MDRATIRNVLAVSETVGGQAAETAVGQRLLLPEFITGFDGTPNPIVG